MSDVNCMRKFNFQMHLGKFLLEIPISNAQFSLIPKKSHTQMRVFGQQFFLYRTTKNVKYFHEILKNHQTAFYFASLEETHNNLDVFFFVQRIVFDF